MSATTLPRPSRTIVSPSPPTRSTGACADFRADPRWDRLVGHWQGMPYLNQFYRSGWQTRRKNTLAYFRATGP